MFADSLPDGWGHLLIDRMLTKMRINSETVSILDRLAILGKSGMGALEYVLEYHLLDSQTHGSLAEPEQACADILNDHYNKHLEELIVAGGSS